MTPSLYDAGSQKAHKFRTVGGATYSSASTLNALIKLILPENGPPDLYAVFGPYLRVVCCLYLRRAHNAAQLRQGATYDLPPDPYS